MLAVAILNLSSKSAQYLKLAAVTAALERQIVEHVQPLWRLLPPALSFEASGKADPDASPLVIFDHPDQADALGYHSETPGGLVYGRVFLDPIFAAGGTPTSGSLSVSSVLSHELLEMIGDPAANVWADGADGLSYAQELCDPCESDSYFLDEIALSNFVLPAWFDPLAVGGMRLDYMGKLKAPFTMTPGGYLITRDASGVVKQVFGAEYPEWKKKYKAHAAARTARRRQRKTSHDDI